MKRVWLSSGAGRAWTVVVVASALAGWHGWGVTVTPERPFFWIMAIADLVVAAVAARLAVRWPGYAMFGDDAVVLERERVRYDSITAVRTGHVSAKGFWLAFWLPLSLLGGVVVALLRADAFERKVVELDTPDDRLRMRWKDVESHGAFLDAVRTARPDLEPAFGLDGPDYARDCTPRLSVGGGFLALGLVVWLFFAGLLGVQLLDRSTVDGPYSVDATSYAIRSVTERLTGNPALPGVPVDFSVEPCARTNGAVLGPSPDVVDLRLRLLSRDLPGPVADAVESGLRKHAGMAPGDYLDTLDIADSAVRINIPEVATLHIDIRTGCVDDGGEAGLREDLRALAAALGVER
ncbi:hypothetical protein ACQPZF_19705 [Actinosynnema sp. CS-041913]|uniref:hypothetical protein n=1 Tax=Actinosynnema sp. CS-041913 TaxID=3239917 RepID=UPI003D8C3FE2